jgi:murein DD-endopeptidase MepM/ murein hydrolase activator NlpD
MTGGFVASVVLVVLVIVATTPEYARPAHEVAAGVPSVAGSPAPVTAAVEHEDPDPISAPPDQLTGYRWPLRAGKVLAWFGPGKGGLIRDKGGRLHEGIDIATFCTAPVTAAHKGIVKAAGRDALGEVGFDATRDQVADLHRRHIPRKRDGSGSDGSGKDVLPITVVIDDGNGYRSVYRHLADVTVKRDEKVKAGALIGHVGQTGGAPRCHLQYELVRMDGEWLRVAEGEGKRVGYPKWIRERVDPLLVLDLDAKDAPGFASRNPPPGVASESTVANDQS